jgi:hypothetical protein
MTVSFANLILNSDLNSFKECMNLQYSTINSVNLISHESIMDNIIGIILTILQICSKSGNKMK